MMLLYVTTNSLKFNKAATLLAPLGIELEQANFPFLEIQGNQPEKILKHKLNQAYEHFQKPVLVSDDTWSIPVLKGFPGAYMKDVNSWFSPEDWLRLMQGISDRRIFLEAYLGYKDSEKEKIFHYQRENYFLEKKQGEMPDSPHLTVIGKQMNGLSIAQDINQHGFTKTDNAAFWRDLATWLKK